MCIPNSCNTRIFDARAGSFYLEQRLSRRCFCVIAGAALLAGCQPQQQMPAPGPTSTSQPSLQPITLQNAQHLVQVAELDAGGVAVRSVAWSPDNLHIASGSDDTTVRLWGVR